ncbi:hypothetical protein B5807_01644 [Epicoccum nigrum]|uniref:RING-type E3 ubiquitin transferase n=1 Tax=Epicoccum nigrum TaxID=105696 RepID=A0A1Y2MDU1_EPING|nr:hypothetical protein B5807_01644 [Epicoccum nigrum]
MALVPIPSRGPTRHPSPHQHHHHHIQHIQHITAQPLHHLSLLRRTMASPRYTHPFATSPDIIRSHQKDAYFSGVLLDRLSTLVRKTYGARTAHTYTSETRVSSELLYLFLTTFLGNRTLGEEYCDIVQVEAHSGRLPALGARAGYILSYVLAPYGLGRVLPTLRRRVRAKLEANLRMHGRKGSARRWGARLQAYVLAHLDALTSPGPVYALSLATFYFTGSYYHLSKRLWGLRYLFTRQVAETEARAGYEVLGVLLVLQMAVQGYLHLHSTVLAGADGATARPPTGTSAVVGGGAEVSLDPNAYTANNALLFDAAALAPAAAPSDLNKWTNTPAAAAPRFSLEGEPGEQMGWIGAANRKCTLCLDAMRDPSVTTCGHVFCWGCIVDWAREKPECPLCRQECRVQHVLPLRG